MSTINLIKFDSDDYLKHIEIEPIKTSNFEIKSSNVPESTDLIPGKYEGGLKIWECSIDLLNFLQNKYSKIQNTNMDVLELGCGHGFPGIYMLLKNSKVVFQDFNKEVLENCTLNYIQNLSQKYNYDLKDKFSFIDGDWSNFNYKNKFDLILSADTLYSVSNYDKIYEILRNYLNKNGVAYFASKRFYFGVGGSTAEFMEFIKGKGEFNISKVKEINNGISNIRDILEITWINK